MDKSILLFLYKKYNNIDKPLMSKLNFDYKTLIVILRLSAWFSAVVLGTIGSLSPFPSTRTRPECKPALTKNCWTLFALCKLKV